MEGKNWDGSFLGVKRSQKQNGCLSGLKRTGQAHSFCTECVLSHFSHIQLFATVWTVASQAPLSMGFPRQEYWSGLPCPPPGHLPNPGIESKHPVSPALAGGFFTTSTTWEAFCEFSTDLFYILVLMSVRVLFSWVYC